MLRDPLVVAFELATVEPVAFRHREHLYVAWCYLRALPLEEALLRYVHYLRRLTVALGAPGKYHATITWAYVVLLHDVMQDPALPPDDFDALLRAHPSLLDSKRGMLAQYYDDAELASPAARERFVLPRARSLVSLASTSAPDDVARVAARHEPADCA